MDERAPRFSIVIPARNEEAFIGTCLSCIQAAAGERYAGQVQIIVVINRCTDRTEEIALAHGAQIVREDAKNLSRIRNAGVRAARGEILVTVDADSFMSPNMLRAIDDALLTGRFIGGGVRIHPSRWSLGIFMTAALIGPYLLWRGFSGGLFWCLRRDFEFIGGFDERMPSAEDVDFAVRLRKYGQKQGKRFVTLWRPYITTSCRKFDQFGDWFWLRDPRLTWQLLRGTSQAGADRFWYDVER